MKRNNRSNNHKNNRSNNRTNKKLFIYIVNVIKSDDKKGTAFQQLLEFFLYFFIIIGLEVLKSIVTEFIKTGEFTVTGVTISVAIVAVIFSLPKEKIKEAIKKIVKKASSKKNKRERSHT